MTLREKYSSLDGLRGIAALVVVFSHYAWGFFPSIQTGLRSMSHTKIDTLIVGTPLMIFFAGNFAVCVFFVLSGFVLSIKFFQKPSLELLTSGALRRYLRLMLPAASSVIVAFILLRFGLFFNNQTASLTGSGWLSSFWQFPANLISAIGQGLLGIFFTFPAQVSYNTNLWTMQLELLASIGIFGGLALFGNLQKRWLVYLALVVITFRTYFLAFVLGVLIADVHTNVKKSPGGRGITGLILLVIALFLASWPANGQVATMYSGINISGLTPLQIGVLARTIGAAALIIAVLLLKPLAVLLSTKPVKWLGHNSFALYLIHLLILGSFSCYLFNALSLHHGYKFSFVFTFIPSLALIFLVTSLYTKFIDQPAIRLAASFSKWATRREKQYVLPSESVAEIEGLPVLT